MRRIAIMTVLAGALFNGAFAANRTVYHQMSQHRRADTASQDLLQGLRYQLEAQEDELSTLQDRVAAQESSIDGMREEAEQVQALAREIVRQHGQTLDSKLASFDVQRDGFNQDLRRLQEHANQLAAGLDSSTSRLAALESTVETQSQNLEKLEAAVQALVQALQPESSQSIENSTKSYKVVEGDTLERIARRHGTTIKRLKELNDLKTDRIYRGQTLKVPE